MAPLAKDPPGGGADGEGEGFVSMQLGMTLRWKRPAGKAAAGDVTSFMQCPGHIVENTEVLFVRALELAQCL